MYKNGSGQLYLYGTCAKSAQLILGRTQLQKKLSAHVSAENPLWELYRFWNYRRVWLHYSYGRSVIQSPDACSRSKLTTVAIFKTWGVRSNLTADIHLGPIWGVMCNLSVNIHLGPILGVLCTLTADIHLGPILDIMCTLSAGMYLGPILGIMCTLPANICIGPICGVMCNLPANICLGLLGLFLVELEGNTLVKARGWRACNQKARELIRQMIHSS